MSHQGTKTQRNTKIVGADSLVRPSHIPWDLIQNRLENDYKVYLLVDNIPVTLCLVANFSTYNLSIRPKINECYVPDFFKPIFEFEKYPDAITEILDKFYQKRKYITKIGRKNKKLKRESYVDALYYYSDFPNFKAFKKHYQENFHVIIILDAPIEPAPNSLLAGLSKALSQPQIKALNPGEPGTFIGVDHAL